MTYLVFVRNLVLVTLRLHTDMGTDPRNLDFGKVKQRIPGEVSECAQEQTLSQHAGNLYFDEGLASTR